MPAGGSIVNIASTDAFIGSFRSIAYSASEAALLSVTYSLANVLGHISKAVAFLLSKEASFIAGSSIVVDGGYTKVDYFMKKENDSLG